MTKAERHKKTAESFSRWLKGTAERPGRQRKIDMFNTIADTEYDVSRPQPKKIIKVKKVKI